jgi:hypothetical protein
MLAVIRAARAALGPGNDRHGPRSAAQPGFVILRCLTPAGKTDTETQSLKSGGIARSGPCRAAMGLHFDLDAGGEGDHMPHGHCQPVRLPDQHRPVNIFGLLGLGLIVFVMALSRLPTDWPAMWHPSCTPTQRRLRRLPAAAPRNRGSDDAAVVTCSLAKAPRVPPVRMVTCDSLAIQWVGVADLQGR